MSARIQENKLLDLRTTSELIRGGRVLVISGEEELLEKLPKGNWIGGTIPYFYLKNERGRMEKSKVFVSDFTESINDFKILTIDEAALSSIALSGFTNGFSFVIFPSHQRTHYLFALNAQNYHDIKRNPLIGIIAGTDLKEFRSGRLSMTFNGATKQSSSSDGVVLHCSLLPSKFAKVGVINLYERSDEFCIEVFDNTFTIRDCLINGELGNLYQFIKDNKMDINQPLICDCDGLSLNVSFQFLIDTTKEVVFYAPLFKNKKYYFSKKPDNYKQAFQEQIAGILEREKLIIYNCISLVNYINGELNKSDIGFSGVTTFGEIAYFLLNQTFTYLAIDD